MIQRWLTEVFSEPIWALNGTCNFHVHKRPYTPNNALQTTLYTSTMLDMCKLAHQICKREWFWVLCFYFLFKWNIFSITNFTFIQLCFENIELILNFQRWKLSVSNFLKIIFKVFILDWRRHHIKHMDQKDYYTHTTTNEH